MATKSDVELRADADGFVAVEKGYALGLKEGKLVCRNAKGALLSSVPKDVREGAVAERLLAVRDFLAAHDKACELAVEGWMLRSLPTPMGVLTAVWADASYRRALENTVFVRVDAKGNAEAARAGFLKGVDAKKGLGLVTLDGETAWEKAAAFLVPHPILLPELDDFRSLAAELGLTQVSKQLFREVFTKPKDLKAEDEEIAAFRGGKFEEVSHARAAAKSLGYRCTAGWVATRVFEGGRSIEARYWIGGDDGDGEAYTEGLSWVDEDDKTLRVAEVPDVAFSEGMRMASAVYGKRAIEKEEGSDA
jgi:hypothetical protein